MRLFLERELGGGDRRGGRRRRRRADLQEVELFWGWDSFARG